MIPHDKDYSTMGNLPFALKNINHPLDKIFGDMAARLTDFTHAPVTHYRYLFKFLKEGEKKWYN
jgi:hypothetical protein